MARDFYLVLGITRSASQDEVKKAFRTMAKKHHPDHGGDESKFKEVSEAYSTLSDATKRRSYDFEHRPIAPPAPRYQTQPMRQTDLDQAFRDLQAMFRNNQTNFNDLYKNMYADPISNTFVKQRNSKIQYDPFTNSFKSKNI